MKQQEVFKKIGGIINEINEQYQYLQQSGEENNDLELELMLANAHFLGDHIEILRKISKQMEKALPPAPEVIALPPAPEPIPVVVTSEPEPITVIEEPEPTTVVEEKPAGDTWFFEPVTAEEPVVESPDRHTIEFNIGQQGTEEPETAEAEPETIRHELTLDDIGEDWDEEDDETVAAPAEYIAPAPVEPKPAYIPPTVYREPEPEPQPEPVYTPPSVVIQPEIKEKPIVQPTPVTQSKPVEQEEEILTFNQRMSAQMATPRVSDNFGTQAITDLKSAITLNDKLLYIKDLFNGYSLAYSEAIDILNRLNSLDEAKQFLETSYAAKNNWADKQATVDRFYNLLGRRYA